MPCLSRPVAVIVLSCIIQKTVRSYPGSGCDAGRCMIA